MNMVFKCAFVASCVGYLAPVSGNIESDGADREKVGTFSNEKRAPLTHQLRLRVDPQEARLTEKGIAVHCDKFGEVLFSAVEFDDRGPFLRVEFSIHCTECNEERDHRAHLCPSCHSSQVRGVPKVKKANKTLAKFEKEMMAEVMPTILEKLREIASEEWNSSQDDEGLEGSYEDEAEDASANCVTIGYIGIEAWADSDGNRGVEGQYEDETEDGSKDWGGSGKIEQHPDGSVTYEAKVKAGVRF